MRNVCRLGGGVVLGVLAGGWIAMGRLAIPLHLGYAAVAALGFTVAGYAVRRRHRNEPDGVGRGAVEFSVFAGVVIGLVGAALVSGRAVLVGIAVLIAVVYGMRISVGHERWADCLLAVLTGLPIAYGALAVGRPAGAAVPWILTTWLQLVRVTVNDVAAEPADRARGRRTLTVRLGRPRAAALAAAGAVALVPASLVLPARAGYGGAYFLVALFAQLAVLVTAARVIAGRPERSNLLLTGAMVMGAVALVAGRVT